MKTYLVLLSLLGFSCSAVHAWQSDNGNGTFKNPVLYADYPDPDIIRVTNDFYMVSTTFSDSPGINVLHSKDLVNWEIISHCCTNLDWAAKYNMSGGTAYRQGFWAGSIRYYNGVFYVLANPVGANARMYYATNAAGPWQYYQLNQGLYDASLLIDTNGAGYIFYGYSPQQSVATLNANFSQIVSVSNNVVLSGGEGSHAVRVGNYYYLFNANPGVWPYQLRCARATNVFGPWETNHVCLTATTGGHQGAIVDLDDSGTNYYGFVHQDSGAVGRMTRLGPVFWSGNWPVFGTASASNQMAATYAKPVLGQPILQPATSDEFTNATLGLQWQWNHNPDNAKWSLAARPGYLRLLPTQATNFWVARNTLTQKGQGPWSRGEVKLDVSHLQPGDICGFGTLGMTNGQIAVNCDSYGNRYLSMNVIVPTTNSPGQSVSQTSYGWVPVTGSNVFLRMDLDFQSNLGLCAYSFDGTNYATLGSQFNLAFDISISTFQGEKYAIFCYNTNASAGYVDVDYFRLSDSIVRGRPRLNAARTTFVADNGQLLRGPFTSTEWTAATAATNIANIRKLGFNAVHLYAENFSTNYPNSGNVPGYSSNNVDAIVAATRTNGLYLVITIGNGAYNGNYNLAFITNFWNFYAPRYANETHVLYEIQNEPVAWGPPYSSASATPTGAVNMEAAAYRTIRATAPSTPVLLFTYAVLSGSSGASAALTDIQSFNTNVFGTATVAWTNEAVAFHGYAGWQNASTAAAALNSAGYPCFMTEFTDSPWSSSADGLDAQLTSELERLGISWLTFQYIPPSGVASDVTQPAYYSNIVINSGLSWNPDYGNWPPSRGSYGNGGQPRLTATNWSGSVLTGTLRIEAEDFDTGGEGVAYHELTTINTSGQYRTNEAVDIETTTDSSSNYDVTGNAAGEWLEYSIWVREPGYYNLALRYAAPSSGASVQAICNAKDKTGAWALPGTGSASTWQTVTQQVFLEAGRQKLHLNILNGGFNLNWIELSPASSGIVTNGTYKFLNRANGLAMQGLTSGSVVASNYSGATLQQWTLQHLGAGQYKVTSANNGWSWNISSSSHGSLLGFVGYWSASDNQTFILTPTDNGFYRLLPVLTGFSLETTSTNANVIDQYDSSTDARQQWGVVSPSTPAFPIGLSATASAGQVSLLWNVVSGATSYIVKRGTNSGGPYLTIATGVTATNYTDVNGIVIGTQYYYVVSAVTGTTESLNSAEASATLPWPTMEPLADSYVESGNPAVNYGTSTNLLVKNNVTVSARNTYLLFDVHLLTNVQSATLTLMPNRVDDAAVAMYYEVASTNWAENNITWNNQPGGTGVYFATNTVNAGVARVVDVTAVAAVAATNGGLLSIRITQPTNSLNGLIQFCSKEHPTNGWHPILKYLPQAQPAPNAPTNLTAIAAGTSQINLSWRASDGAASYNVKRSLVSGSGYTTVAAGITMTNYSDTGLADSTTYYYVVSAVSIYGESANSVEASATTLTPPAPGAPTNLLASLNGNQVALIWAAVNGAATYNVKRAFINGGPYATIASGISGTNYTDTAYYTGMTYYYVVSAVNSGGESSNSPQASVTTATTLSTQPLGDAYVESGGNGDVNFGGVTNLLVKNNVTAGTAYRAAYLMFDVRGLGKVQSATLTLMPNRVDDAAVAMYYEVASTNWAENNITWNNQPGGTGVYFATNTVNAGVARVVDVTAVAAVAATNGGLLSIRITQPTNSLNGLIQFCSKEHPTNGWRPVLEYVNQPNAAPILPPIADRVIGAGTVLLITNTATDGDVLAYSLLAGPTNATINAGSGVLTWRPWLTQAPSTNAFVVKVVDDGVPSLGATQGFEVVVTNANAPVVGVGVPGAGMVVLTVNGDMGPDYRVQASTNLTDWSVVFTTNAPAMPFVWTNNNTQSPLNFFRIQSGPPF